MAAWTGGYPRESNPSNAYVYDPATNTWQTRTALLFDRRRGSTAVIVSADERKIYVSHGTTGGHEQADFSTALGFLDVYDIATDSWTALSDSAPNPHDHTGGALIHGRICVAGGRNGGEIDWPPVAPTDCYDLVTGEWTVEAPIPQVRSGSSYGMTCDGHLIVAGGEGGGQAWQNVDVFNGSLWISMANLVVGRHGSGLAVDCACNRIHIASGAISQGGGPETQSVETYFPSGSDIPCSAPTKVSTKSPVTPPVPAPAIPLHCSIPQVRREQWTIHSNLAHSYRLNLFLFSQLVGTSWQDGTKYPITVSEAGGAIVGGNTLVISSGFQSTWSFTTLETYSLDTSNPVASWVRLDDQPLTLGLTHCAFTVVSNKFYMCGGYSGGSEGPTVNTCLVLYPFKPSGQQWSTTALPSLPGAGQAGGGMVYDTAMNALFVSGGALRAQGQPTVDVDSTWMYLFNDLRRAGLQEHPFLTRPTT
jgi:N-acetylneuraminic acid mutarotase